MINRERIMKKTVIYLIAVSCGIASLADPTMAADWMLRVVTTSRVCHVQPKTATPLGQDMKGPFSSRKDACQEALNQYDDSSSDQSKCWLYGPGTISGCQSDGVILPSSNSTRPTSKKSKVK
jgi:hypothetical protein